MKLFEYIVEYRNADGSVDKRKYQNRQEIANAFGVSRNTINSIITNSIKKYQHITIKKVEVENIELVKKELRREYNRRNYYKNREPVNHINDVEAMHQHWIGKNETGSPPTS